MPRPEKHVFVCAQNRPPGHPRGACAHQGGAEVLQAFQKEVQARMCYDKVTVSFTSCIGPCDQGANVVVYPEGVLYGHVTPADVAEIFNSHLIGGTPVERLQVSPQIW